MDDFRPPIEEFAELIVGYAANVQPGQVVAVLSEPGKEDMTRAVAAAAYRRGAKFVDVWYYDQLVKRERIKHAAEDTLDYVPPWWGDRLRALGEMGAVAHRVQRHRRARRARRPRPGPRRPRPHADAPRGRRDRERPLDQLDRRGGPDPGLGRGRAPRPRARRRVPQALGADHPRLPPRRARPGGRLGGAHRRAQQRRRAPPRARPRRAPFRGPGNGPDRRPAAHAQVALGRVHAPRRPARTSSTCRPRRSSRRPTRSASTGVVRATLPLEYVGSIIRGIEVRFEGGRAVSIEAERARRRAAHRGGAGRGRRTARRGRAGRPRRPHRPARHRLLRHAAGRERREPHRARHGLHVRVGEADWRARQRERRSTSTS